MCSAVWTEPHEHGVSQLSRVSRVFQTNWSSRGHRLLLRAGQPLLRPTPRHPPHRAYWYRSPRRHVTDPSYLESSRPHDSEATHTPERGALPPTRLDGHLSTRFYRTGSPPRRSRHGRQWAVGEQAGTHPH